MSKFEMNGRNLTLIACFLIIRFGDFSLDFTEMVTYDWSAKIMCWKDMLVISQYHRKCH